VGDHPNVKQIEEGQFEVEVLSSPGPVILDFFSTECAPCEALAPKFEALADRYGDRVRFLKIFRQGSRALAVKLGASSSPTLIFFKAGKEVGERLTGEIQRSAIKSAIEAMLA
jgi:thiol-disulfide isomerase/thioredoxin